MNEPANWNDLDRQQPVPKADRIAELCAEVFTSPAGKELLAEWRRLHFEAGDNPVMDDKTLRVRAAKQHFINEIERKRDVGLKAKP